VSAFCSLGKCVVQYEQEYGEHSPSRDHSGSVDEYKEEEFEDASPKAALPIPEELPAPEPVAQPVPDLLDLDSDFPTASALEDSNALALAIIPEGTNGNGNIRIFDVNDPSGWELALVTNPTDSATAAANHKKLAGGLDKHLLDSLYDDALQRRGPSGPVPNSYNMGLNMPGGNPFQTPGPGMRPQHMDPFMASSQYAPNSNVQMAMMQQQQAMLMQQQQLQQQQQMMGMAPVSANPFGNPYAGPVGAQYPYGSGLAPEAGVQQPIPGQLALPAPPPAYQNPFGNPGLL